MVTPKLGRILALSLLIAAPLLAQGPRTTSAVGPAEGMAVSPTRGDTCGCPNGTEENEILDCNDLLNDTTNGGCNSIPPVFGSISCGETICGTAGAAFATRDTDWFHLVLDQPTRVVLSVTSQFDAFAGIIHDGAGNPPSCPVSGGTDWMFFPTTCVEAGDDRELGAGTWFIFVATVGFDGVACGTPYTLTVECPVYENDFEEYPPDWSAIQPAECTKSCGIPISEVAACYCDVNCVELQDCCLDACATCGECAEDNGRDTNSCSGYCGGTPNRGDCYCDFLCLDFNDCCGDACAQCGVCF